MANKNHALDERIVQAAKAEFMEQGFRNATLQKIAARAGVTTGAVYTRYENKDALFCSLVSAAFDSIRPRMEALAHNYYAAGLSRDPEEILEAIRQEERAYLDVLFDCYDECVLFICRSDGSSVQEKLKGMMAEKSRQTIRFLRSIARRQVDFDGIAFIIQEQFRYYRLILEQGLSKEKALSCMRTVEAFMEAGWKSLFEKIL